MKFKLDKAWTQRTRLRAEGDLVFIDEVIAVCGMKARIEWPDTGCVVMGVMEFLS